MSNLEEERDQLRRELQAAHEMLAAVLNEVGPTEVNLAKGLPAGAQIMIDDGGEGVFTFSLVVPE